MTQQATPDPLSASASEEFAPIEVDELAPCCLSRPSDERGLQAAAAQGVEVPRGTFYDAATYRRMKDEAVFNPAVPQGDPVEFAEDATETTPWPLAPRIRKAFPGRNMSMFSDGWASTPPDTTLAAGRHYILQATNSGLQLSDRNGKMIERQSLNANFGQPNVTSNASNLQFDPKVYFDILSGRFIIVALDVPGRSGLPKQSFLWLSISRGTTTVSRGGGPLGLGTAKDWCNYKINTKRGSSWGD